MRVLDRDIPAVGEQQSLATLATAEAPRLLSLLKRGDFSLENFSLRSPEKSLTQVILLLLESHHLKDFLPKRFCATILLSVKSFILLHTTLAQSHEFPRLDHHNCMLAPRRAVSERIHGAAAGDKDHQTGR